jgi:hypothetical protein
MSECANCATMRIVLTLVANVLAKVLPKSQAFSELIAMCRNAAKDTAGSFLMKRAQTAEAIAQAVIDDIKSTGPFKIKPSQALQNALAAWTEMTFAEEKTACKHEGPAPEGLCAKCGAVTCRKCVPDCKCAVGFPYEEQCVECRDGRKPGDVFSHCVCPPSEEAMKSLEKKPEVFVNLPGMGVGCRMCGRPPGGDGGCNVCRPPTEGKGHP